MDTTTEVFDAAIALYNEGRYDEALGLARRTLEEYADEGRLWELCGLIHRARREPEPALHALEMASLLVPLGPVGRCVLAECYAHQGKRELARDLYQHLLASPGLPTDLLLQIAAGLDQIGDPVRALKTCRDASRQEPEAAQPYYDMGYYMGRCGYPQHLIEGVARKAIALAPERVNYRIGLASFLMRHAREEDAYDLVRDLTAFQIREVACRCCLDRIVAIFEQAGDWTRAKLCRDRLLQLAVELD